MASDVRARRRARLAYDGYRLGAGAARLIPDGWGPPIAENLGRLAAVVLPARRRLVVRHATRVAGRPLTTAETRRALWGVFGSYGRYWLELFRLPVDAASGRLTDRARLVGFDAVERACADGRGVILALPHVGGFDYAGAYLAAIGYPPMVVVEPVEPPELFEWFASVRRTLGMEVVPLGSDAAAAVLAALRDGRMVCLLADRDIAGDGVPVEFFGETTTLPGGPALLALRTGAALFAAAAYFRGRHEHVAVIGDALPVEREGRLRDDVVRVTQMLAHRFEDQIRVAPEQWHLMQPNWPSDRVEM